jgi:hypothetical protein
LTCPSANSAALCHAPLIPGDLSCSRADQSRSLFLVVSVQEGAGELDPPPDAGISSSAKSVVAFRFPDLAPPLAFALAALPALSRSFRASALVRLAGESAFWGGAMIERRIRYVLRYVENPKCVSQDISSAPTGPPAPAGQTGTRQCTKTPGAGPRGNTRASPKNNRCSPSKI